MTSTSRKIKSNTNKMIGEKQFSSRDLNDVRNKNSLYIYLSEKKEELAYFHYLEKEYSRTLEEKYWKVKA